MSDDKRCSARPQGLMTYVLEVEELVRTLRHQLRVFDDDASAWGIDPMWDTAFELEDLRSWVANVAWAFAIAGGQANVGVVRTFETAVDAALHDADWHPANYLRAGTRPDAWMVAVNPRCITHQDSGYGGTGFIEGRDGRLYPLVAPWVVRDGVRYDADDGVRADGTSVLELDGRDDGWFTLSEQLGVERWRDAPGLFERTMMGVGATVGGRVTGSQEEDVDELVLAPGVAPYFGGTPRVVADSSPPPYMVPVAPDYTPPGRERTKYPGSNSPAGIYNAVPIVIEGVGGAAMADSGSFAAYDITFQQNVDGRIRALYRRVYVDELGNSDSVWITGPERNDQVLINYAPAS